MTGVLGRFARSFTSLSTPSLESTSTVRGADNDQNPGNLEADVPDCLLVKEILVSILTPSRLKFTSCNHENHLFYNRSVLSRFRRSNRSLNDVVNLMQGFWCGFCRDGYAQGLIAHPEFALRIMGLANFAAGEDTGLQILALSYTVALACFHEQIRAALSKFGMGVALDAVQRRMSALDSSQASLLGPAAQLACLSLDPYNTSHQVIHQLINLPWAESIAKTMRTMVQLYDHLESKDTRCVTALSFAIFAGSDLSFWIANLPLVHAAPCHQLITSFWEQLANTRHALEIAILSISIPMIYNRFRLSSGTSRPAERWGPRASDNYLWRNLWMPLFCARVNHPELFQDSTRLKISRFVDTFEPLFKRVRHPASLHECISPARWYELRKLSGLPKHAADSTRLCNAIFGLQDGPAADRWIARVLADAAAQMTSSTDQSVSGPDAWLFARSVQSLETVRRGPTFKSTSVISELGYGEVWNWRVGQMQNA